MYLKLQMNLVSLNTAYLEIERYAREIHSIRLLCIYTYYMFYSAALSKDKRTIREIWRFCKEKMNQTDFGPL